MYLPIPGTSITLTLPWIVYLIFAVFAIVAENNAVNLTDGIDGLAAGVTLPVAVFFTALNYTVHNLGATVFAAALIGALCAFLIYNFNPAKVFMGDTGSLFLGGCVIAMGMASGLELLIPLVGVIYIVEALSDVIQILSFKIRKKRVFKMAPIHHHFELCGWSEYKILFVFAGVTAAAGVLGVLATWLYTSNLPS